MNEILSAKEFLEELVPDRPTNHKFKTKLLFDISSKILDYRLKKNMSQKALADFFGVTQGMISKWESCEYNFSIEQVCKISEKLSLTPKIEFFDTGNSSPTMWKNMGDESSTDVVKKSPNLRLLPVSA